VGAASGLRSIKQLLTAAGKMRNAENLRRVFCGIVMRNNICGMVGKMWNGNLRNEHLTNMMNDVGDPDSRVMFIDQLVN